MINYSKSKGIYIWATSPINIALVKYWGKVDEDLIIPANDSLSLTIDQNDLCSKTLVQLFDSDVIEDEELRQQKEEVVLILNGKEEKLGKRVKGIIQMIKDRAADKIEVSDGQQNIIAISKEELLKMKIRISSENNFATASGLASSSSGLSCLSYVLARLYGVQEQYEGEYSKFARLGSGSACRSLYGGIVQWHRGYQSISELTQQSKETISNKSISLPIKLEAGKLQFWLDNLRIIICVVKPEKDQNLKKEVPSTDGMKLTLETSDLMKLRLETNIPSRHIQQLIEAFDNLDFHTFSEITMKESNQLHAVCLDTYPPIFYMNETSRSILKVATKINQASPQNKVAYSIDAGFHVFLFMMKKHVAEVEEALKDVGEGIDRLIHTRIGSEGVKIVNDHQ